jgi:uncharacterized protein YndB with AHSA1/START domain
METPVTQLNNIKPEPLIISRVFPAPRILVFQAWSSAEHMKNWFSPEGFTVPEAEIDFREGGVCNICMRSAAGEDFWSRGHYIEISPPGRLVFLTGVVVNGERKFSATTIVTLEAEGTGTRMSVRQEYEIFDPAFMPSIDGAQEGWRTTLDKFASELSRIQAGAQLPAVQDSFTLERVYPAAPAQVFHALTNLEAKSKWFAGGDAQVILVREMNVVPGGREIVKGQWPDGTITNFEAHYFDVTKNRRLVYAYEMHYNTRKLSVSLATIELTAQQGGTHFKLTEQGSFLDGYEDAGSREHGTGFLLDQLGEFLKN